MLSQFLSSTDLNELYSWHRGWTRAGFSNLALRTSKPRRRPRLHPPSPRVSAGIRSSWCRAQSGGRAIVHSGTLPLFPQLAPPAKAVQQALTDEHRIVREAHQAVALVLRPPKTRRSQVSWWSEGCAVTTLGGLVLRHLHPPASPPRAAPSPRQHTTPRSAATAL